jgi:hypothetical protein
MTAAPSASGLLRGFALSEEVPSKGFRPDAKFVAGRDIRHRIRFFGASGFEKPQTPITLERTTPNVSGVKIGPPSTDRSHKLLIGERMVERRIGGL